jgi:alkyl hydroperoxide reductase subunit AhpC
MGHEPRCAVARKYNACRPAEGFSERALYVLDAKGVIRYACGPGLGHMPDVYDLYRALSHIMGLPAPKSSAMTSGSAC